MPYSENEIRRHALQALARAPHGKLTTSQLIDILTEEMHPTGQDAEVLNNREDTYFSQKVRNLVSHRNEGQGLQVNGLADYNADEEGWTITDLGRHQVA
ncbi:hypothetical protein JMM61_20375 [Rhodovulum sulfidophilum]|uniref:hypothetical protein n=1 Tax=Rhodovulum sulfidophilum TaxID=35806 RepID=UPI00192908A7|nr:hypothetical protein [Rhodovulum sulfidophilum]MBL3587672.1 hypothetical protein [Rhodovulum sulfidophilum]